MSTRVNNTTSIPSNVVVNSGSNAGASITARQTTQSHQQQTTQPTVQQHLMFQPATGPIILPFYPQQRQGIFPQQTGAPYHANYQQFVPYFHHQLVHPQQHRSQAGAAQNLQTGTPLGANVGAATVGGANTQQQQQPSQHQPQLNPHTTHYMQQQTVNPPPMQVGQPMGSMYPQAAQPNKAPKKILQIIHPDTGVDIMESFTSQKTSSTSGSTTSAALSIDKPSAAPVTGSPALNQSQLEASHEATVSQVPTTASTVTLSSIEQAEHDGYTIDQRELINDVPPQPHTPVVSAIVDGPSVDIPPKQSKTIKRR